MTEVPQKKRRVSTPCLVFFLVLVVVAIGIIAWIALGGMEEEGSTEQPDAPSVHIFNDSTKTICTITFQNITNALKTKTSDSKIEPGKSLYFEITANNWYIVTVKDCDGHELLTEDEVSVADKLNPYSLHVTD